MNTRENVDAVKAGDAASGIESLYSGTASTAKIDTRSDLPNYVTNAPDIRDKVDAATAQEGRDIRKDIDATTALAGVDITKGPQETAWKLTPLNPDAATAHEGRDTRSDVDATTAMASMDISKGTSRNRMETHASMAPGFRICKC